MGSSRHTVISRPVARAERLLVEMVDDETVIYDQDSHVAHALNPLAAAAFMYADGKSTPAEIAELASHRLGTDVTESAVVEAVRQLEELELVNVERSGARGLSRRDALKVFGAVGAGTALVSSVAAPTAFAASNQTPSGDSYWCAISGHAGGDLSIDPGYGDTGWPQPTSWNSDGSPGVELGVQVAPGGTCAYNASTKTYCTISSAPTSSSHCADFGGTWNSNTHVCTGYGKSEPASSFGGSCPSWTTPKTSGGTGTCATSTAPTSQSACSFFGGTWNGTCVGYNPVVAASGGACAYGTYSSGTDLGYWQCVPCDGSDGYQCCSVVCAPANTGYAWGANASKSFANVLGLPSGWYPYVGCGYNGGGTDSYTACAAGTGQGTPDYHSIGYDGKYCTYNQCGANGGKGCTS
jgi:hypothetical protein